MFFTCILFSQIGKIVSLALVVLKCYLFGFIVVFKLSQGGASMSLVILGMAYAKRERGMKSWHASNHTSSKRHVHGMCMACAMSLCA